MFKGTAAVKEFQTMGYGQGQALMAQEKIKREREFVQRQKELHKQYERDEGIIVDPVPMGDVVGDKFSRAQKQRREEEDKRMATEEQVYQVKQQHQEEALDAGRMREYAKTQAAEKERLVLNAKFNHAQRSVLKEMQQVGDVHAVLHDGTRQIKKLKRFEPGTERAKYLASGATERQKVEAQIITKAEFKKEKRPLSPTGELGQPTSKLRTVGPHEGERGAMLQHSELGKGKGRALEDPAGGRGKRARGTEETIGPAVPAYIEHKARKQKVEVAEQAEQEQMGQEREKLVHAQRMLGQQHRASQQRLQQERAEVLRQKTTIQHAAQMMNRTKMMQMTSNPNRPENIPAQPDVQNSDPTSGSIAPAATGQEASSSSAVVNTNPVDGLALAAKWANKLWRTVPTLG
jgi:hypothetical protein